MPSIDDNLRKWGRPQNWAVAGDEWSASWGTSQALWCGTILRRVASWLPAGHLLELAPGHGRVTEFLLPRCARYTGVDVAPLCTDACETRFAAVDHATFHTGDGKSLPQVEAASVDFVFSWDSLVHADRQVLAGYLHELGDKLRKGASGFLHHSNLGAFVEDGAVTVDNPHWRDASTSAVVVRELCRAAGLQCVAQELVQWGTAYHGDCFTVLRRPATGEAVDLDAAPRRFENPYMNEEIGYCRILDAHYRGPAEA